MARYIRGSEDGSGLSKLWGERSRWVASAIPPYTMVLLAEEALEAKRVEQAECLIEAVYALYD
jgi:hypothetical protein